MTASSDFFNELVNEGINVYGSREKIRLQLIDYAKKYLQLETVDFYKPSVLSYIIDSLSILSANHIFYDSMIYREFFMVEAQMQESVYNLARWIGYKPPLATASKVNVMFTFPLAFQSSFATFAIPATFKVKAGSIPFTIDSISESVPAAIFKFDRTKEKALEQLAAAKGKIINNTTLSVRDSNGFFRPVYLSSDQKRASFLLPFTQHEKEIQQFIVPDSLQAYQFFSRSITFKGMISTIKVYIMEPKPGQKLKIESTASTDFDPNEEDADGNTWVEWTETPHGLYTMGSNSPEFVLVGGIDKAEIFFGNGIIGRQPKPGSKVNIITYVTLGTAGHVIPESVSQADKLYYTLNAKIGAEGIPIADVTSKLSAISFTVSNPVQSNGGADVPSLPEIKRNAIINLRSKNRLVSEQDYDDINTIMGESFPSVEAYPILKRSDIKINEIMSFLRLSYHDEFYEPQIVPTRNAKFPVYDPTFVDNKYTLLRKSKLLIDTEYYETLFNITIDNETMTAGYEYILQNVYGSPTKLYDNSSYDPYNNQFAYIPITTIDFNILLEPHEENDSSSSSSSSSSEDGIYPLRIKVKVDHIYSQEITKFRCRMITKWDDLKEYEQLESESDMSNKIIKDEDHPDQLTYIHFTFEIPNYLDVPQDLQRFEFVIEAFALLRDPETHEPILDPDNPDQSYVHTWQPLGKYFTDVIIRQDLSDCMMSSVTKTMLWNNIEHDYFKYEIHNVPVILSSYLDDGVGGGILNRADNLTHANFEMTVIQSLVSNLDMKSKRMLTDFINIKFPDTYGNLNNLKYNQVDYIVNSRYQTPFEVKRPDDIMFNVTYDTKEDVPVSDEYVTRFIANAEVPGYETNQLCRYICYIAEFYPNVNPPHGIWHLVKPERGMYVKVVDEINPSGGDVIIVFDGLHWVNAEQYKIPLEVYIKVEINPRATMSKEKLIEIIKENLISHFTPRMGIHKQLDRSEILAVTRSTESVVYAEVVKPEIDIRFDFDIKDLTQEQLLDYTPQYIGFNEQTIKIEVIK